MAILIIVFLIVLSIQVLLAVYSMLVRRSIPKNYNVALGHQIEAAETLESYVKIFRKVDLRLNADIPTPAHALKEFVLLNRDKMYLIDLYTNYYLLYQLEMSKKEHNFKRNIYGTQNIFFFLQFVLFAISFFIPEYEILVVNAAILIQFGLIIFSFLAFSMYDLVLQDVHLIAKDILNLDEYEESIADTLKRDLKFHVFEYPFDFVTKILRFFLPAKWH